jgi:hypothetical protein
MKKTSLLEQYRRQKLLTESEAAKYMRLTERKLYGLNKAGVLPRRAIKGSKRFGYRKEDLDSLLE